MIRRGDKGPQVKELQSAIIELGFPMPRYGADGQLGTETLGALALLLKAHGRPIDEDDDPTSVSDEERALVMALRDLLRKPIPVSAARPVPFVDRRKFASRIHDEGPRAWPDVTGICLHQTACDMGERDARFDNIGAHAVVCRSGKALWMHDFDRRIVHGNGFNTATIGIEFVGLFAGIEGDESTVWDDPSTARREVGQELTPQQVTTGLQLIRWMVGEVARRGGKIRALVAHRQASASRRSDPGSALWQRVALPLHTELGLSDGGVGFKLGKGTPIPEVWDPRCKGVDY